MSLIQDNYLARAAYYKSWNRWALTTDTGDESGKEGMLGHAVADAVGRIIAIDESVSDFLEFSKRELLHRPYRFFVHALDRCAIVEAIDRVAVDGPSLMYKARVVTGGSRRPYVNFAISRFQSGQDEGRIVATFSRSDRLSEPSPTDEATRSAYALVRRVQHGRATLGTNLHVDAVIVILTEAYIAEAEGRLSQCRSAFENSRISLEIGRRWLLALAAEGLISPASNVDVPVELTELGHQKLRQLLANEPTV